MRTSRLLATLSTLTFALALNGCDGGSSTTNNGGGGGGGEPECGNGEVEAGEECDEGTANSDTGACTKECKSAACGDGKIQSGVEDCDLGAENSDTGGCTSMCKAAKCGDALVQAGVEACDNGTANSDTGDCTTACQEASCGDGLVHAGSEECDEGADNSDTGACTTECKDAACGDGNVQDGVEECDQGNANSDTGACTTECKDAVCGDGLVQAGVEGCDDMNMIDNDECTNVCALPSCGDGIQQAGEACDLGMANSNTGTCTVTCKLPMCGDSFTQVSNMEQCDNGGANSNTAACTAMCKNATCGDGFVFAGMEECDNGAANNNTAACTAMCKNAKCGDGFIQTGIEPCDDGNMTQGDGCNNDCKVSGTPIWTQIYNTPANNGAFWAGVTTDSMGNVYVVGAEGSAAQGDNLVVRKYNASGVAIWTQTYNGAANLADQGLAITLDPTGNVVVVGFETIVGGTKNIVVRKYNGLSGALIWPASFDGGVNGDDYATGVVANAAGDLFITGSVANAAGQGRNILAAKLAGINGTVVWSEFINGTKNLDDEGAAITLDSAGAVIVSGYIQNTFTNGDAWVRKYTDMGVSFSVTWTRTNNNPSNGEDGALAIATDGTNNVIAGGFEGVTGQGANVWLRKYDAAGNTVWTQTFSGAANLNDTIYGLDADSAGNIAATGFEANSNATVDVWVRRYTPAGVAVWTQKHNGAADQDDAGYSVSFDPSGNVVVAGQETASGPVLNAWLRKYAP